MSRIPRSAIVLLAGVLALSACTTAGFNSGGSGASSLDGKSSGVFRENRRANRGEDGGSDR